jgi:transposase
VTDLPPVRAEVTEYRGHGRRCPGCGEVTWQSIPAEYCRQRIGPGLAAAMGYLAGCHQVSKRGVEEFVETLFAAPLAPGSVANVEKELSAALTTPHIEAVLPVQEAPVKHVDETGRKRRGKKGWLWVAANAQVAAFVLHPGRGLAGLALLLGPAIGRIVVIDPWRAYRHLPVCR